MMLSTMCRVSFTYLKLAGQPDISKLCLCSALSIPDASRPHTSSLSDYHVVVTSTLELSVVYTCVLTLLFSLLIYMNIQQNCLLQLNGWFWKPDPDFFSVVKCIFYYILNILEVTSIFVFGWNFPSFIKIVTVLGDNFNHSEPPLGSSWAKNEW